MIKVKLIGTISRIEEDYLILNCDYQDDNFEQLQFPFKVCFDKYAGFGDIVKSVDKGEKVCVEANVIEISFFTQLESVAIVVDAVNIGV